MNKLNEKQIEKLIDFVRTKPGLYDKSSVLFKTVNWKNEMWKEIAENLNCDANDCKTAWRSLRDQFTKCLKDLKGRTGQAEDERKPYKNFNRLLFLKDSLAPRRHFSNFDSRMNVKVVKEGDAPSNAEEEVSTDDYSSEFWSPVSNRSFRKSPLDLEEFEEVRIPNRSVCGSDSKKRRVDDLNDITDKSVAGMVKSFDLTNLEIAKLQCTVMTQVTENITEILKEREKKMSKFSVPKTKIEIFK